MGNDAFHNMDASTKAAIHDNEIDQLEYEQECLNEGDVTVKLTLKQFWFLKCACEAKTAILPLLSSQLNENAFVNAYGVTRQDMCKVINRLETKLKATQKRLWLKSNH